MFAYDFSLLCHIYPKKISYSTEMSCGRIIAHSSRKFGLKIASSSMISTLSRFRLCASLTMLRCAIPHPRAPARAGQALRPGCPGSVQTKRRSRQGAGSLWPGARYLSSRLMTNACEKAPRTGFIWLSCISGNSRVLAQWERRRPAGRACAHARGWPDVHFDFPGNRKSSKTSIRLPLMAC